MVVFGGWSFDRCFFFSLVAKKFGFSKIDKIAIISTTLAIITTAVGGYT